MSNKQKPYYNDKEIVIVHESEYNPYVLCYYAKDKKKSKFKLNLIDINYK